MHKGHPSEASFEVVVNKPVAQANIITNKKGFHTTSPALEH
jgi:hypothetical protein